MPIVKVEGVDKNLFAFFYSLGDQQSLLQTDPATKKVIGDLVDKFKGEDAERKALLPVLQMFDKEVGTMILGQKSNLDLVEQTLRQELSKDFKDGQDLRIKILEKAAGVIGIDLDISNIEL